MTRDEIRAKGAKEGKMTNGDKIRAMSNEKLADIMQYGCCEHLHCMTKDTYECNECWLDWLNQEAE